MARKKKKRNILDTFFGGSKKRKTKVKIIKVKEKKKIPFVDVLESRRKITQLRIERAKSLRQKSRI